MQINRTKLISAAKKVGISESKSEELWSVMTETSLTPSKFDLSHVLYYFGAMIVIIAMGWFVGVGWESLGGGGILAIALIYIAIFVSVGTLLWRKYNFTIPGGLFITMAVCLIPLAIYGFQKMTGLWIVEAPGQYKDFVAWVRGGWFMMEVATILGGIVALFFFRFPFLTMPIFFSLWFMSMDITPLIYGSNTDYWQNGLWVSLWFGFILLVVAFIIDRRTKEDYAFWAYFFGALTFWCGISWLESDSEMMNFLYCLMNIGLIFLSIILQRTIFLVLGTIGVFSYITMLFYRNFSDSFWFPIVLSFIGVVVVFLGITYHKHHEKIEATVFNLLPKKLQAWLPKSRKHK